MKVELSIKFDKKLKLKDDEQGKFEVLELEELERLITLVRTLRAIEGTFLVKIEPFEV